MFRASSFLSHLIFTTTIQWMFLILFANGEARLLNQVTCPRSHRKKWLCDYLCTNPLTYTLIHPCQQGRVELKGAELHKG